MPLKAHEEVLECVHVAGYLAVLEGQDASITYNGTDVIYDSRLVGTGDHEFEGGDVEVEDGNFYLRNVKAGATQVGAGAAADEVWVTSSHATLPDGVLMLGN